MKHPPRPPNDLLTIVYPESAPNSLVRRQAGHDYQDNIALDSQIAPLKGVLYTNSDSDATEGAPSFTPVDAVPDSGEARADTDEVEVDINERQSEKQDVVKNNVESDPQNTYLQVS